MASLGHNEFMMTSSNGSFFRIYWSFVRGIRRPQRASNADVDVSLMSGSNWSVLLPLYPHSFANTFTRIHHNGTVLRPYNGNSYIGKVASLHWNCYRCSILNWTHPHDMTPETFENIFRWIHNKLNEKYSKDRCQLVIFSIGYLSYMESYKDNFVNYRSNSKIHSQVI